MGKHVIPLAYPPRHGARSIVLWNVSVIAQGILSSDPRAKTRE